MQTCPVDPRDTGWEIDSPSYRVYLWRARAGGYESEEFELSGVRDVGEAIAWAESAARSERTYTLYVLVDQGDDRGLVRLLGVDPTAEGDGR